MNDQDRIAWLARRAAFGLAPGEPERFSAMGVDGYLDWLVEPEAPGGAIAVDPFAGLTFDDAPTSRARDGLTLVERWFDTMLTTPRPLREAMTWFWHDHFAVSYGQVKAAQPFARYLSLLRKHALGDFKQLIADITVDPAMLIFLDGATSTAAAPNENYGRELLELYTVGIGSYTEADVHAAAVALSGWVVRPGQGYSVTFVRTRHDARPQQLAGRTVSDVASVVDAAVQNDACAPYIAAKLAAWFLGPDFDRGSVPGFAKVFRDNGLAIAPLVRAILQAGLDGHGDDLVLAPVPWLMMMQRALGVRLDTRVAYSYLSGAGQAPLAPPNVGGWPGPSAWLGASATAMRVAMASALVDLLASSSPVLQAAASGDLARLATALGRPAGFSPATRDALRNLASSRPQGKAGAAVAVIAIASPDLLLA